MKSELVMFFLWKMHVEINLAAKSEVLQVDTRSHELLNLLAFIFEQNVNKIFVWDFQRSSKRIIKFISLFCQGSNTVRRFSLISFHCLNKDLLNPCFYVVLVKTIRTLWLPGVCRSELSDFRFLVGMSGPGFPLRKPVYILL